VQKIVQLTILEMIKILLIYLILGKDTL